MSLQLLRPRTIAIFAADPSGVAGAVGKIQAFLLTQAAVIDLPGRVRLDTVGSYSASSTYQVARSPVERTVADNFIRQPRYLSVEGTLSASGPLLPFGAGIGAFGSLVRRDIMQTKALRDLQARGEPLIVVTPSEPYPSMALVSLQETHAGPHQVRLSLAFEEIEIVSPFAVTGVLDFDAMLGGSAPSNMGAQPVATVPDPGGLL
jgi:hypothetical protein